MSGVSKEQIARAKEWDLLSYLRRYAPEELRKCGTAEYCTATHDSLRISNGKWKWNSQGIGGRTALDYLIKVQGMGFVEAVRLLCSDNIGTQVQGKIADRKDCISYQSDSVPEQKPVVLPAVDRCGTAMVSYLLRRGIDGDIINHCISLGILYESSPYHNCVFVGRDPEGVARFAFQRGTYGEFKGDVEGSDKRYNFCIPAGNANCERVTVAEGPVDALSVATLRKLYGSDWENSYYLALGGTAPCALLQFLQDHKIVTHVQLCLDNDTAGLIGTTGLREALQADKELSQRIRKVTDSPPPTSAGKDYNEYLQRYQRARQQDRQKMQRQENLK